MYILGSDPNDFLINLAAGFAQRLLERGGRLARDAALGTEQEHALQRVLERAFTHVYAQLVENGEEGESAEQVVEALHWIAEEFDAAELLFEQVLASTPSADAVSQLLDEGGFEYDLIPTNDMAAALIVGFHAGVEAEASIHDNPLFEAVMVAGQKQIIGLLAEALNRSQQPPEPPRKTRIFLSYVRSDDEPFVKRLYEDLKDEFDVWWDRVSMPNRGPTFTQEIRDAIEQADRLLLVAGTGALSSDYVKYEWMYAYEIGKAINIALRKCDYTDLPEELKNYDAPDFREDADYDERLQTLVRQMTEPVAPMGQFHDVPALPPHFLQRPDALDALRDLVIADVNKPTLITAEKRVTAVEGMSGIGKSGLATAFAHDRKVRSAFPNGIVWVTAGRKPSLFELYRAVGIALGDELRNYRDESTARQNAQHMLQDKKCLLILDDVWELLVGRAFRDLIHGTPARLLITTRNLQINDVLNANEYRLDLIGPSQAVDYLRSWVGRDDPDLVKVAQKLGYLFLALKLAGARMKKDGLIGAEYLATFDRVSRMKIDRQSTDREDSLEASIALSVDAAFMDEEEKLLYHTFGIFQEDATIPQQTILQLWAYLRPNVDTFDLSEILTALVDLALVERHEDKTITLHNLLHSYAREKLGERYIQTHQDLLDSYRVEQWHELPPGEPYLWRNIAYHLTETKQTDILCALLLCFDWLQAKLDATDANALLSDFAGLTDDEPLRLLESAISMSAHAITDDKHQLAGQLVGRLIGHSANHPKLASFVEQARAYENYPALLPQLPTLTPAGGPLIRTIPLQGTCNAMAFTDDGDHAIVVDRNHIRVFEIATGTLLTDFAQHTERVSAVAVKDDIVASGDGEGTVKVWRWRDGTLLTDFTQHTDEISAVAVQGDIVVSCDSGGTVKVWRWAEEELLTDFTLHTERVNAVAVQGDIVVSGSWDHTVKVWRWEDGTLVTDLTQLTQHTDKVYALAIQGEIVVSGAANGTMKAWRWRDGTLLTNFTQHTGAGAIFAVAVQGEIVVSGDGGSTVKVWRWADGKLLTDFTLHTGVISAVAVQGDIVISGSCPDNIVKMWRWKGGTRQIEFKPHQDIVNSVAIQDHIVVSGSLDHTVKVWRWEDGELLKEFKFHTWHVGEVVVQGDIIVFTWGRMVRVFRWRDEVLITDFRLHTDEAMSVVKQGEIIVSGSRDRTVKVWRWQDGTLLADLRQHSEWVSAVAMQGEIVVSGSADRTVKVWRWADGTLLTDFSQHVGPVYAVALQDDIVVSGDGGPVGAGGTVKVWRWEDGMLLTNFTQHTRGVYAVAVQGKIVVSGSDDGTVKAWRWDTGEILAAFTSDSLIHSLAIDPDQHIIVAGDFSGHVHVLRPNATLLRLMAGERYAKNASGSI